MRAIRLTVALCVAFACSFGDVSSPVYSYVALTPLLDSLFVGDSSPPPSVTYFDGRGGMQIPSPNDVRWSSSDATILGVDSITGRMAGRLRGVAFIVATVKGAQGGALVVVSNTLDLTLLLDTVYVMPGDTLTVPVVVQKKHSPPLPEPVVWYEAAPPSNAVYTIDSASGLLRATGVGGPVPYIVHADTLADTGAVSVLTLAETTDGKFFFSVLGTAITRVGGSIRAVNYAKANGDLAFKLRGTYAPAGTTLETVQVILPDSVIAPGAYAIDSMSPGEVSAGAPSPAICAPPRPWALWSGQTGSSTILAYSRPGGTLGITQLDTVANGLAISGRFAYTAQRRDLYSDPLGLLTVRGSFVAPLVTDRGICR